MQFTAHSDGPSTRARRFQHDGVDGVLWTPLQTTPQSPAPLVFAGQPGGAAGLEASMPRLEQRASAVASAGLATFTLELPGAGARPPLPGVDQARRELRGEIAAGRKPRGDLVDRLILPLVDQAVPEILGALDALLELPELKGPVGYSGGVIAIAVRALTRDPRFAAAILFAGSLIPERTMEEARALEIPVTMLLQWDDTGNDRERSLALFDAFAAGEKTLIANMGGHLGVPAAAGAQARQFLASHLRP